VLPGPGIEPVGVVGVVGARDAGFLSELTEVWLARVAVPPNKCRRQAKEAREEIGHPAGATVMLA
jgi:hypothetical protein